MKPSRLPMIGWIADPEVNRVMHALLAGTDVEARYVGGAVRDTIRGAIHPGMQVDVDIATTATPEKSLELLGAAGIKAVPTGIDHGTITAVSNHRPVEITTLRRDVATDGRRAEVAYTTDWMADAARRDFTMNAIYAGADGTIYDPLGGVDDAIAGRVRFMGDADARIQEDYLRILRFFRFYAWCGKAEIDSGGLQACARHIAGLAKLSPERVAKELLKLISAENPMPALRQMAASGILGAVLPEAVNLERLNGLAEIDAMTFFEPEPVLRLAALLPDDAAAAAQVGARLRLSNAQRDRLVAVLSARLPVFCYMSAREMRRTAYRMTPKIMRDAAMLRWAGDARRTQNTVQWRALLPMIESWKPPRLPLDGHHARLAGVPDGPKIGEVLREVEEWWIDADFIMDEYALLERMKAIVQATIL